MEPLVLLFMCLPHAYQTANDRCTLVLYFKTSPSATNMGEYMKYSRKQFITPQTAHCQQRYHNERDRSELIQMVYGQAFDGT